MNICVPPAGKRAGFTLIELLVVIAIIAILAAILFPVFAQAKDAAKNTQSLSNVKQVALSALMYENDSDDVVPIYGYNEDPDFNGIWHAWPQATQPYRKNWDILYSPAGGPKAVSSAMAALNAAATADYTRQFFSQYGYNATYMNPLNVDCYTGYIPGNFLGTPISSTAVGQPASTVFFTEVGQDAPEDNVGTDIVYPPGGFRLDDACTNGGWGIPDEGPMAYSFGPEYDGAADKTQMGFFRPRHSGGGVVAWVDGHAKWILPGALAAGTNWKVGMSVEDVQVLDRTNYLWDLN